MICGFPFIQNQTRASYIKHINDKRMSVVGVNGENIGIYWYIFFSSFSFSLSLCYVALYNVTQSHINLSLNINKHKHAVENGCDSNIQKVANIVSMSLICDIARMLFRCDEQQIYLFLIGFFVVLGHLWLKTLAWYWQI